MDLIGFLYGFGVLHGVVLAGILLYSSNGYRPANVFMAALVTCIALRFLNNWLVRTGYFMDHPGWGLASVPLDFAWGPLLYLYAFSASGRRVGFLQSLHFLPCLLMLSAPITFAQYTPTEQLQFLSYFWGDRQDPGLGRQVLDSAPAFWRYWVDLHLHGSFFTVQFGIYCFLVIRQAQKYHQSLEKHYSFTDDLNLRWLSTLTYLCVFFLLLFLIFNRVQLVFFGHFPYTALTANTPFLFMVLAIYIMGIMALKQPRVESRETVASDPVAPIKTESHEQSDNTAEVPDPSSPKYARSGITPKDEQRYKFQLMKTMEEQELYLDCDLTLGDLAKEAGMTYHQASQVINNQMNQKFFSFVNSYRIQRAREMLSNPSTSNMPIVELALEVGFKSKSSFYSAFKKATSLTPTQFRKSLER